MSDQNFHETPDRKRTGESSIIAESSNGEERFPCASSCDGVECFGMEDQNNSVKVGAQTRVSNHEQPMTHHSRDTEIPRYRGPQQFARTANKSVPHQGDPLSSTGTTFAEHCDYAKPNQEWSYNAQPMTHHFNETESLGSHGPNQYAGTHRQPVPGGVALSGACDSCADHLHWNAELTHDVPSGVALVGACHTWADVLHWNAELQQELQNCRAQLGNKDHELVAKNGHIKLLKEDLKASESAKINLQQKVEKAQEQIRKERAGLDIFYVDGLPTPFLLDSVAKDVFTTISLFTAVYAKYRNLDGSLPARSLLETHFRELSCGEPYMTRKQHWSLLLKSVICSRLFHNFETEEFVPFEKNRNTSLFLNPEDRVNTCFGLFKASSSAETGNDKFLSLRHDYISSAACQIFPEEIRPLVSLVWTDGQLVQFDPEVKGLAKELILFQSFIIAAKKVWEFHKLCLSFDPPATIFRAAVGDPFVEEYMDSNDTIDVDEKFLPKVGFMIYPGFRLRKSVIKCRVYFGV